MKSLTMMAIAVAATVVPAAAHADTAPIKMTLNPSDADKPAAERRYCIKEAQTGSRMKRNICKTPAEWAAEGLTVGASRG